MKRTGIRLLLISMLAIMGVAKADTPPPGAAADLIVESFQAATAALREHHQELSQDPEVAKRLMLEILAPHVDFELLSRLVLGRYWRSATADERRRFIAAFRNSLVNTYAAVLSTNMDRVLAVLDSGGMALTMRRLVIGEDARRISVRTSLDLGDQAVAVDFQMRARGDRWLIYDVVIEGISFASSRRSELTGLLQNQSLDEVIERLSSRD